MFCSTIIPTVNRSTLSRSVESVLGQSLRNESLEVIVVNDSGESLPGASWQLSDRVQILHTNRRERSVARNTGAAIARGKYLHFLDDDDILLPGAMGSFWELDQKSTAVWLYGGYQTVDNQGDLVAQFFPGLEGNIFSFLVSGESIPLQASLVRSDIFFAAGAFDPVISGVEDRDLGRRIALLGDIAYAPCLIAQIRIGEQGSTTDWNRLAEDDRWGREKALAAHDAFARLKKSPKTSYWHGRVSRAYFASTVWNLQRMHLMTAIHRVTKGIYFTGNHILYRDYWQGLTDKIQ
jgi:glycosyltransferase involved in cell wall biosynthesis